MKRKVIKLAGKTSVISLPCKWVKHYNIQKGDELDILERGNELIVRSSGQTKAKERVIDISELHVKSIWFYIFSIYRTGASEIKVIYNTSKIKDPLSNEEHDPVLLLHTITDRLNGMEVVKVGKNHCIIKEVGTPNKEEFEQVLRRIFLSILSMADESLAGIKENDKESLKNIHVHLESNINKLVNFGIRILNTTYGKTVEETIPLYTGLLSLESIGDAYSHMCNRLSKDNESINIREEIITLISTTNNLVHRMYNLFYKSNMKDFNDFHVNLRALRTGLRIIEPANLYERVTLNALDIITNLILDPIATKISVEDVQDSK